jgi:hypothetical protein
LYGMSVVHSLSSGQSMAEAQRIGRVAKEP